MADLAAATSTTRIRTPDTARLIAALDRDGVTARLAAADTIEVRGADPNRVARTAAAAAAWSCWNCPGTPTTSRNCSST